MQHSASVESPFKALLQPHAFTLPFYANNNRDTLPLGVNTQVGLGVRDKGCTGIEPSFSNQTHPHCRHAVALKAHSCPLWLDGVDGICEEILAVCHYIRISIFLTDIFINIYIRYM